MKECAACNTELSQDKFSKKQWKLKQHERRCKDCIDNNNEVQMKKQHTLVESNTAVNDGEEAPSCYICLDDDLDASGGEVRRDCSCRGPSAGFVHLSCLAKYAEEKYLSNVKAFNWAERGLLWKHCPTCKHEYQSEFAVDLAKLFVSCMERRFKSQPLNINIIRAKITVLETLMVKTDNDDKQSKDEAKQFANDILRNFRRMKLKRISTSANGAYVFEAYSYECLGNLCQLEAVKNDGRKQLFQEALKNYEKSLAIVTANNDPSLVSRAESMISTVRSNMGGDEHVIASLHKQKKLYEREAKSSESAVDTIHGGVAYAEAIKRVQHRGVESKRLLEKLREICQRVHGSNHKLTKHVREKNKTCFTVRMKFGGDGDSYILMDYDGSFEKCVGMSENLNVLNAMLSESKGGGGFRLPIDSLSLDDIVFDNGTMVYSSPQPVGCNGDLDKFVLGDMRMSQLVDMEKVREYEEDAVNGRVKPAELNFNVLTLGDIRAWDKDTKCYTIHWEDESIPPCKVPRDRVFVPNCICDKCIESNKQFMFVPNRHFPKNCEWDKDK